jgi:hypothetical protein
MEYMRGCRRLGRFRDLQYWWGCRGEAEEGEGREAIQALNIALTHSQKRDPDIFSVGAGLYKITPANSSSLGKGVNVRFPPPPALHSPHHSAENQEVKCIPGPRWAATQTASADFHLWAPCQRRPPLRVLNFVAML